MAGKSMVTFYMLAAVAAIMINVVAAADPPPVAVAAAEPPVAAADPPVDVATPATAYINHTVGGSAGWFFNADTNQTSFDYAGWAANQTFNLGDYLIFNTDSNSTVIQTYNLTTYQSCSIDDALDTDTFDYMGSNNVNVALTIEAPQYYFSDANDGLQCQHGMAFAIKVGSGLGLPPSLNQPPPPPYIEPPSSAAVAGDSPPVTILPSSTPNSGMKMKVGGGAYVLYVALMALLVLFL